MKVVCRRASEIRPSVSWLGGLLADGMFARPRASSPAADGRRVVALVCEAVLPYHHGGRELRYQELARRIADRADVHVYTMHWWSGPRVQKDNGITFHAISRLIPMYRKQRRSVRQALHFALACIRLLGQDFDVLSADNIPFLQVFVLRLVTTLKRRRLVVTWHEVWGKAYWRQYLGTLGLAAWLIEIIAMRMPDHILAASPQTADRLRQSLGQQRPISLAIHGIDLGEVSNVQPVAEPSDIAVVGRLMTHKRVDMLIEAIALLHGEGERVTCRVIGDGPERDSLHNKVAKLGLADSVQFYHDVSEQKDVYALLKAAHVCVFPSAREGFGVAVVEALACGSRVITTRARDNLAQHLVARSERGMVCEPSASAIAEAIRAALAEHEASTGPGVPEAWLWEYSWDAVAHNFSEALQV